MLGVILLMACQDNPEFPDPKFDSIADQEITVRRDTANSFTLTTTMDVPNGIGVIQVLDGRDYSLIEEFTEYRGQTQLDFSYTVDVSKVNRDTVYTYLIKVTDLNSRSYNKAFIVNLKKISVPEIFLLGGETIGVSAPAIGVKALIQTGMVPIKQVNIRFEDEEVFSYMPEQETVEYKLSHIIYTELQPDKNYKLEVELIDSKLRKEVKTVTVKRIELEKPIRVICSGYLTSTMELKYDPQGRLSGMDYKGFNYHFIYGEASGLIDTLRISDFRYSDYREISNYIFYYNNEKHLTQTTLQRRASYDEATWVTGKENTQASAFVYRPDGTLKSFVAGATTVDNVAYADGFAKGERIFSEIWQNEGLASASSINRYMVTGHQPVYMPTYLEGLPYPVVSVTDYMGQIELSNIFFNKYVFTSETKVFDPTAVKATYTYETDDKGRLKMFSHKFEGTRVDNYTFEYE